jgi:hypothetical protein
VKHSALDLSYERTQPLPETTQAVRHKPQRHGLERCTATAGQIPILLLLRRGLYHLDASVVATRGTHPMRQAQFVALWAGNQVWRFQSIVSAPSVSPPTGDSLLGDSPHRTSSFHPSRRTQGIESGTQSLKGRARGPSRSGFADCAASL